MQHSYIRQKIKTLSDLFLSPIFARSITWHEAITRVYMEVKNESYKQKLLNFDFYILLLITPFLAVLCTCLIWRVSIFSFISIVPSFWHIYNLSLSQATYNKEIKMLCGGTGDVQEATAGHEIHDVCNSVSSSSSFIWSLSIRLWEIAFLQSLTDLLIIIFLFGKGKRSSCGKIGQKWIWHVCSQKL